MLPVERETRAERVRMRRRAATDNDGESDEDDDRAVENLPWRIFDTDAEETRNERAQRILGSRKKERG